MAIRDVFNCKQAVNNNTIIEERNCSIVCYETAQKTPFKYQTYSNRTSPGDIILISLIIYLAAQK